MHSTAAETPRSSKAPERSAWHNPLRWPVAYARWLHLQWPGGTVEKLPLANPDGSTNVAGLYVVGDLTGVPLLKLSANAGHDAVEKIAGELEGEERQDGVLDLAIIGGGTAGFSAALEAERRGLRYCVFEASTPFNTIKDFPKGKTIYTYPTNVEVKGFDLHEKSGVKEGLVEDLEEQTVQQGLKYVKARTEKIERKGGLLEVVLAKKAETPEGVSLNGTGFVTENERVKAKRVVVAIGRSGNYRKLGVPGEDKSHKVTHRLYDPKDHAGQNVLVVGGGDSAIETATALAEAGADVTLSYRKREFSRPKPENQERIERLAGGGPTDGDDAGMSASDHRQATGHGPWARDPGGPKGRLTLMLPSEVREIRDDAVVLEAEGEARTLPNDQVFLMIGREAPLDFFRRSGVRIRNERTWFWWASLAAFLVFCFWMYHWIKGKPFFNVEALAMPGWLNVDPLLWIEPIRSLAAGYFDDLTTLGGTIAKSMEGRSFYYTLAYCLCVIGFGIDRVRRRRTPYVYAQTATLTAIQVVPLFLLPEIILPWMGYNGWFDAGWLKGTADELFPVVDYGHGREYWRAYGLVLAWPLMAWNLFTDQPIWGWVVICVLQTFVLIPAMIYVWGKGAYCGWICSCGALAETLGDRHRHKMPHGVWPNRLNLIGQVLLLFAVVLQAVYILRWVGVGWAVDATTYLALKVPFFSWAYFVDLLWAGIIGVGFYFWLSGRVWCRFACPLAAVMHIFHRFSRFAILAEKKKCISCNVCTSVCHQGIDVMSFANKGRPMVDPQCVRCSACVQMCPTGVLSFGTIDRDGNPSGRDPSWLAASPVRIREGRLTDPRRVEEHQAGGANAASGRPAMARASKPVGLTVNGRRVRKSADPSPLAALLAHAGVRG